MAIGTSYLAYQLYKKYFVDTKKRKYNLKNMKIPITYKKIKTEYSDYYFDKNL